MTETRVFVAGHRGLVGSALERVLSEQPHVAVITRERSELDLRDPEAVGRFFADARPQQVYLAAGRVGGIHANSHYPANFIRDNLQIQTNVIDAAWRHGVEKLCFLGSSCIYPRLAPQPIPETALLTGALEPTNEWYAIAKIAGIRMCQAYRRQYGFKSITLMPTNLYGPNDNFSVDNAHVLPALIRRFDEAVARRDPRVVVWGTGTPRREFLYADDLASAAVHLMATYDDDEPINVGTGVDLTIAELAAAVAEVVGYSGRIEFDASRPDGTPRKLLDVSRLHAAGWQHRTGLRDGLQTTYAWYRRNRDRLRA